MNIDRWQQIEGLLDAALEVSEPAERALLLNRACAGDAELRAEVESLLAHHAPSETFIEAPAFAYVAELLTEEANDELENRRVGAYKIIREIGRGGMGAVFLAERADGEFEQRVALKVVRRGFADSDLARRFRRERQILATLNHENVARLLDGGVSADGEPFLVMEHVEGARIDDYCDANGLSEGARLRVFLKVCEGVAYAHQRLVVHRDIKPSNIIVTGNGTPKLLDFGIAKLLDPEQAGDETRTEHRAFTPEYASPEQVRGESVTTISDVYSLGVLLRSLLQGADSRSGQRQRRLEGWRADGGTDGRTVATNLPTRPEGVGSETSHKFYGAELRNIIRMATREEPDRRYQSVAQLAEDVRRYLAGLPVRAQPDTLSYRASKFVRRNKAGVATVAVILLALISGIAAVVWQSRQTAEQARIAAQERDRAERRFSDVRHLSNALLTDIAPKIERLEGSTEARQALVVQSLKYLNRLSQEAVDEVGLQMELAAAYERVADLQGNPGKPNLGDFTGAISSYERANQIRRALPATKESRVLLAENFRGLANVRYLQNDIKGALRDYAAAAEVHANLLTAEPHSDELRMAYLKSKFDIAELHSHNNQYSIAVPMLREIVGTLEQFEADQREARRFLAAAYAQLGNALSWDDKQREAEAEMAKATAIADRLAAENPNDTNIRQGVLKVYFLASGIYETIDDEIALQFARKALRLAEQAVSADAADVQAKQNVAKLLSRVGNLSANLKRFPEAISNLEKSEKVYLELVERDPANRIYQQYLGILYTRFGDAKHKQGDLRGALRAFQKSAAHFEDAFQRDENNLVDRRNLAQSLKSLGKVYLEFGERSEARENFQRALDILNRLKAQNALGDWDNKMYDEIRNSLQLL
ncbi:MAG TPA: serine/threonine-protein kinase [Pyrinomonadaceae bacterium]